MTNSRKSLPYDMGNIGDLLKHGVMAEFIRWWSINHDKEKFVFSDPFCGCPWESCANLNAIKRLEQLRDNTGEKFEILNAQPDFDKLIYYGSAYVALHQIRSCHLLPDVYVSDKNSEKVKMVTESYGNQNIEKIKYDLFYPDNGYSILDSINRTNYASDMVLIDPFEDMGKIKQCAHGIAKASEKTTVVLFALINDRTQWEHIWAELPKHRIILACDPLEKTGIKGENKYTVAVVLISHLLVNENANKLRKKLEDYVAALTNIVGKTITCI